MSHEENGDAFNEGGVFVGKDSEIAETSEKTNFSTKTPDYEYQSEPLRQHRRFFVGEDFEEKDSETAMERTEKLFQLLNNNQKQFYFSYCIFCRLYKFFFLFYLNEDF